MDDAGNPRKAGEEDVDAEVDVAARVEQDSHRRQENAEHEHYEVAHLDGGRVNEAIDCNAAFVCTARGRATGNRYTRARVGTTQRLAFAASR